MQLRAQYLYDFAAASSCSPRLFVASFARLSYYQCWFKRSVLCEWRHQVPCQGTMALSTLAALAKKRRLSAKLSPFYLLLLEDAGRQDDDANQQVYLVTVSRALPGARVASGLRDLETLTRAESCRPGCLVRLF